MNLRTRSPVLRAGTFALAFLDNDFGRIFIERSRERRKHHVARTLPRRRLHDLERLWRRIDRRDRFSALEDVDRRALPNFRHVIAEVIGQLLDIYEFPHFHSIPRCRAPVNVPTPPPPPPCTDT